MAEGNDDGSSSIPRGRLTRLAKLAGATARTAGGLAVGQAKRAMGKAGFEAERAAAQRVLETLGTMKGAAMKLGQQLAMDADALPPEARELMARLFANAPRAGYDEIAEVVRQELGRPPEEVFARFDREPLASASLGQVHRAQLHDGTPVAVKVQYPGVAEAVTDDLKNAAVLARAIGGAGRMLAQFDPAPYYAEIRAVVMGELDYRREAQLAREYAEAADAFPELHVPKVYDAYSAAKVLTLELAEGQSVTAFATSDADRVARWRVGRQMATAIMGPLLRRYLVHGDPHPGNFLVRPDGRLTVLDFGAVKRLSPDFVEGFWTLLEAGMAGKEPDFIRVMTGAGYTFGGDPEKARAALRVLHAYVARPIQADEYDWGASTLVSEVRTHVAEHLREVTQIRPPVESVFFYRAIGGLAQNLRALGAVGSYRQLCLDLTPYLIRRAPSAGRLAGTVAP